MLIDAYMTAQEIMEATGLTPAEILALPHDEYARLSKRPTAAQLATQALGYDAPPGKPRQEQPPAPAPEPAPEPVQEPQGIDPSQLSMEQYAALRGQLGVGQSVKEGRGIFDFADRQAQVSATRAQAGRGALSNANVQQPPRLDGRYVIPDQPPVYRSAQERFSNPSNAWQG